ncbi:hypothetical protein E5675_17570 [Sphingopyxis sp. PAMC25046]|uniref:hypothetical protein n=1 Tax=Sphingopyxis sp. PAMC25046 TaxID=2565556 RepID=UPI00109D95F5|nr:hypothetical protein [Sphingopyxis sp. PAMC25046]QCB56061.1 hypothetical protein E5675_17570 [Sphingopyxis sp. PAMC25046]
MRNLILGLVFILGGCATDADDSNPESGQVDSAPYAAVLAAGAPTIAELQAAGYVRVDYHPVGCVLPDCPDCACDATGAEFLDKSEIERDSHDKYEYVCPAIKGIKLQEWKCRRQSGIGE